MWSCRRLCFLSLDIIIAEHERLSDDIHYEGVGVGGGYKCLWSPLKSSTCKVQTHSLSYTPPPPNLSERKSTKEKKRLIPRNPTNSDRSLPRWTSFLPKIREHANKKKWKKITRKPPNQTEVGRQDSRHQLAAKFTLRITARASPEPQIVSPCSRGSHPWPCRHHQRCFPQLPRRVISRSCCFPVPHRRPELTSAKTPTSFFGARAAQCACPGWMRVHTARSSCVKMMRGAGVILTRRPLSWNRCRLKLERRKNFVALYFVHRSARIEFPKVRGIDRSASVITVWSYFCWSYSRTNYSSHSFLFTVRSEIVRLLLFCIS